MRSWILMGFSVVAIAIRPEINQQHVMGSSVAVVWGFLLSLGLVLDVREHYFKTKQEPHEET